MAPLTAGYNADLSPLSVKLAFLNAGLALPGWASLSPVRHLLSQHVETMSAPGHGIAHRIGAALDFAERLFKTNPHYVKLNPKLVDLLTQMKSSDYRKLAHEYFNRHWDPM